VATVHNTGLALDGVTSLKPTTSYQLRLSLTSTYSLTSKKFAQDEFKLTLEESCYYNKLKMYDGTLGHSTGATDPAISNQQYKVTVSPGTTAVVLTPLYSSTHHPTSCPLTAYFYVWDDMANVWIDKSTLVANANYPFTAFVNADTTATHTAGKLTVF